MAGRMTGIANYSFHLLSALVNTFPDLDYAGFGDFSWSRFDSETLRKIEQRNLKGGPADQPIPEQTLGALIRQFSARSSHARRAYRTMHALWFSQTVNGQSLDLFHAFNFIPPADCSTTVLPVIYDLSFIRYPETHPRERRVWLERLPNVIGRAPLVQTISEFSRNEIATVYGYPKERIFVVPPAPATIFRPLGTEACRLGLARFDLSPRKYLLAVGTLEPRKNLGTLITAYARLSAAERSGTPLVVAGGAGWGDLSLPKVTTGLVRDGSLRFVGMVPDAILRDLYEGAIALLFPSIYEGFGMPVVEALSCGTAVVHSQRTSMDEISGDHAIGLPAMNVELWIDAIRGVIDSKLQLDNAEVRLQRIAQARTFDWGLSAARVRSAYTKLVK